MCGPAMSQAPNIAITSRDSGLWSADKTLVLPRAPCERSCRSVNRLWARSLAPHACHAREREAGYSRRHHLHCNQLGGINQEWEQLVFGLLLRTREGLDRAPVGVSASQAGWSRQARPRGGCL